jgi:transcriptional regulator with XRE-family HTH domain
MWPRVVDVHDGPWLCALLERLNLLAEGLTVIEVGRRTGFDVETTRRYLRFGPPKAEFIREMCLAFGVSADWLLLGRGAGPRRLR